MSLRIKGVLLFFGLVAVGAGCRPAAQRSGILRQDVYVWQRSWTPEVRAALEAGRGKFATFVVFAGEVSFAGKTPKIARPSIDYATLKMSGHSVALALRVDPFAGPFVENDARITALAALARERVAEARANRIEPAELQIDFDCAESKLDGYRVWLRALREAVRPLPVCPTALPSWLKRREFATLARESGRFVLQVHCVEPPRDLATLGKLTDPARAVAWGEQAGQLGVPFRVALPTYTYLVAFDAEGKARGVSAEGPSAQWPAGLRQVRLEADPKEIAHLVSQWTRTRPASMTGVIWYRLPVSTDALNWRWPTLAAVMQGRAPRSLLRVEASVEQPSEVVAINEGERDESLPPRVEASWKGARLVAADALAGYELKPPPAGAEHVAFERTAEAELSRLPPGARRPIGWIRCETPTPIGITVDAVAGRPAAGDSGDLPGRVRDGH